MRPERARAFLLDVPLALLVGMLSLSAAVLVPNADHHAGGPWSRGPGGPDGRGLEGWQGLGTASYSWVLYPALLLVVAAVAVRRRRPRVAFVLVVVGVAGYLGAGGPLGPVLLAPALALHALALALPARRWGPLALLLVPMLAAAYRQQPYLGLLAPPFYQLLVTVLPLLFVPALLGLLRRSRREAERQQRDTELRRYAYEERLQIARDVHDVVGHSLSVINLQAGVALHVLHKRPDEVGTSLEAIKRTSREALAELRTTLAVYRDPEAPLAPPAGLDRLDDLVGALRTAGREVSVTQQGDLVSPLPAAVDQAAYRIVQEALTNVVRHADGAAASVLVRRSGSALLLEVRDDGTAPTGQPTRPVVEGSGIAGMRERAQALGGSLTVSRTEGGFTVRAELPLAVPAGLP